METENQDRRTEKEVAVGILIEETSFEEDLRGRGEWGWGDHCLTLLTLNSPP